MKLTAKNVDAVLMDCLFKPGEDTITAVLAEGVMHKVGLHPGRLESHKADIREMLECLPDAFQQAGGGGMSLLNACMTKSGEQWGEHANIDQLLVLGLATKQVVLPMPRPMWPMMAGGMPYLMVTAA